MKLGFSTLPCIHLSVEEIISYCKKYKIGGIEVRVGNENSIFGHTDEENLFNIGEAFDKAGIKVLCIASSICIKRYEPNQIHEAMEVIQRAKFVGADGTRVFLGNFARRLDDKKEPIDHQGIVQSLKELCQYDRHFNIMVETHNEYATGEVLSKLKQEVNEPNLKFIWDIIHPIEDGEDIHTTWKYIGKDIAHLHIKDGRKREDNIWHDYEYTLLGEGQLPIYEIMDILREENFTGFLSLEWENIWRDELKKYPSDMDFILTMFKNYVTSTKMQGNKQNG